MPRSGSRKPAARAALLGAPLWLVLAAAPPGGALAQEAPPPPRPVDLAEAGTEAEVEAATGDETAPEAAELSDAALEELVAPVALYPDALLAQVLVAATYPLEVMKADRFLDENKDADQAARADLVNAEDWDESVRTLAAGFPDVIGRMAEEIDWTEDLGDAMLAQPDDLLDAAQRLRAQARAVGNLESNEAQTVAEEGDQITIAPAQPDVVYVPSYDPAMAFTTPVTTPATVYDPGVSFTSVLTTGAIAFGSALLIDEIFDDDDDWDDYWHGPPRIDWDDDAVFPRRDIDVNGDVNIDVDRDRIRIGDRDGDKLRRDQEWKPDPERRDAARERVAARRDGAPDRPARDADRARGAAEDRIKARSGGQSPAAVKERLAAGQGGEGLKASKPKAASALKPGGTGSAKAKDRAGTSLKHAPTKPPKAIAKKPKTEHRATPPRKPPKQASALKKPQVSAQRSQAAARRGGKHRR
ncbi:MAG: hypothetical protein DI556_01185 [Rhodovulum sulfidophilum]|uniref:DUF3300 domain-containing protein n=1 Tax=Rhodovulum sulfidophilum TaxID=35806 RepID=A0A2W5QC06_RHOSU|nr:MAG: hypothetical protein DI556_01185 [Rhodovulum sulfidophilum]